MLGLNDKKVGLGLSDLNNYEKTRVRPQIIESDKSLKCLTANNDNKSSSINPVDQVLVTTK